MEDQDGMRPGQRRRPMYALAFAGGVARLGASAGSVTIIWTIQDRSGSAHLLALLLALYWASRTLSYVFVGPLIDHHDRFRLVGYGLLMVGLLSWGMAATLQLRTPWIFPILIYGALGFVSNVAPTASESVLPDIVEESERMSGNAVMQTLRDMGGMIGPIIGAGLQQIDAALSFVFQAISAWAAGGTVFSVRRRDVRASSGAITVWSDILAGAKYVMSHSSLTLLLVIGIVVHLAFVPTETVLLSTRLKADLHLSGLIYGLALSAVNAGSVLAGFILSMNRLSIPPRGLLFSGLLLGAGALAGLAISPTPLEIVVCAGLYGIAGMIMFLAVLTLVQQMAPAKIMGKVFSVIYLGTEVGALTGLGATELTTNVASASSLMLVAAVIVLCIAPLAFLITSTGSSSSVEA